MSVVRHSTHYILCIQGIKKNIILVQKKKKLSIIYKKYISWSTYIYVFINNNMPTDIVKPRKPCVVMLSGEQPITRQIGNFSWKCKNGLITNTLRNICSVIYLCAKSSQM